MARPFERIADLADGQWGLVTRAQARGAKVPAATFARLVKTGRLERVAHGVYRVRGAGETDHLALRAAWLQIDPSRPAWDRLNDPEGAVVSHTSAASLYGVGDLSPDIHEFSCPKRRQTRRRDVRIHLEKIPASEQVVLRGLPATRAGRMIADLLADHVEPTAVAQIAIEVLENIYDYPRVVAEKLAPFSAMFGVTQGDGVAVLERLIDLAPQRRDRERILAEARR